jgi:hypothetical protein
MITEIISATPTLNRGSHHESRLISAVKPCSELTDIFIYSYSTPDNEDFYLEDTWKIQIDTNILHILIIQYLHDQHISKKR